jgi:hypothetical protein
MSPEIKVDPVPLPKVSQQSASNPLTEQRGHKFERRSEADTISPSARTSGIPNILLGDIAAAILLEHIVNGHR